MRKVTLKEFIEEFKPIKQNNDRTYRKYFLVNDMKVATLYRISRTYNCNLFTGTQDGHIFSLKPGRRFSLENSFFIIVDNCWSDYNEEIEVNVKNKK